MITSRQNQLIKKIRSMHSKKGRDSYGEYLVESVKAVREALNSSHTVSLVVATEKGLGQLGETNAKVELVSEDVFESITTEVTPQGVMAIVEKPIFNPAKPNGCCLFLDGVSDPANIGAILRTAASSGYLDVYMADSADPFSPKAIRASMGGIFRVRLYSVDRKSLSALVDMPLVVADMFGENAFNFAKKHSGDFCLVIGNEANGVSAFIKEKATHTVSIPMLNGMESLNAAVSAGILMYSLKSNIGE